MEGVGSKTVLTRETETRRKNKSTARLEITEGAEATEESGSGWRGRLANRVHYRRLGEEQVKDKIGDY